MKLILLFITAILFYSHTINAQQPNFPDGFKKHFDKLISYSDIKQDCEIYQTQIYNSFIMTLNKFSKELKNEIKSQSDVFNFMQIYYNYFNAEYTELSEKLSECLNNSFDTNSIYWNEDDILKNPFTYQILKSFVLANRNDFKNFQLQRESLVDSLTKEYNNWSIHKVKLSDNPIDVQTGEFLEYNNGELRVKILRTINSQFETDIIANKIFECEIKWLNEFEYLLKVINRGDYRIFNCRITDVTDSSYSGLLKSDNYISTFTMYKNL